MAPYRDASYLVLGASGMLGSEVCAELDRRHLTYLKPARDRVDITVPGQLAYVMKHTKVAVINCAGAIPQRRYSIQRTVLVNGLAPHYIAKEADKAGLRVVHVSTDCVFGGGGGDLPHHSIYAAPDPVDIYGRSKLLGEVAAPHVTNVRTSFIGPKHGLMRWAMDNKGQTVEGWVSALWSGSTVGAVARCLVDVLPHLNQDSGIIHLATADPISKFTVLEELNKALNLGLRINEVTQPYIDRSLIPTHYLEPLWSALPDLARHCTDYAAKD